MSWVTFCIQLYWYPWEQQKELQLVNDWLCLCITRNKTRFIITDDYWWFFIEISFREIMISSNFIISFQHGSSLLMSSWFVIEGFFFEKYCQSIFCGTYSACSSPEWDHFLGAYMLNFVINVNNVWKFNNWDLQPAPLFWSLCHMGRYWIDKQYLFNSHHFLFSPATEEQFVKLMALSTKLCNLICCLCRRSDDLVVVVPIVILVITAECTAKELVIKVLVLCRSFFHLYYWNGHDFSKESPSRKERPNGKRKEEDIQKIRT